MRLGELAIVTGGVLSLGVSVGHVLFDRVLGWEEDLARLKLGNRIVVRTLHVALYLVFLLFAVVSLAHPAELARAGGVGGTLALSYAAFWAWRAVWQVVYFRRLAQVSVGWRRVHPLLAALGALVAVLYAGPVLGSWLAGA